MYAKGQKEMSESVINTLKSHNGIQQGGVGGKCTKIPQQVASKVKTTNILAELSFSGCLTDNQITHMQTS